MDKTSISRSSGGMLEMLKDDIKHRWQLYIMLVLPLAYIIIFCYIPMGGIVLAFRKFTIRGSIFGTEWEGLNYFRQFFLTPVFPQILKNTLVISFYGLVAGFPMPIILAVFLNEVRSIWFKKTLQTVTYAPYFISTVVMVGIILQILHLRVGIVNNILDVLGLNRVDFMGKSGYFRHIYVWSGIWQSMGLSAVIYIAALSGVDPSLIQASVIDGVNRLQKIIHIDLPTIAPTIVIQLIFAVGGIMSLGFDKIWLLQNPVNLPVSEIISSFVYKRGIENMQYSYATAVGLFNSVVNFALLAVANLGAKKIGDTSLW